MGDPEMTTIKGRDNTDTTVSAEDGEVHVFTDAGDYAPPSTARHTPAQARELAAVLLRKADEAEEQPRG